MIDTVLHSGRNDVCVWELINILRFFRDWLVFTDRIFRQFIYKKYYFRDKKYATFNDIGKS